MVTLANNTVWSRATYRDESASREPQAIGDLMQQLLSRYGAASRVEIEVAPASTDCSSAGNASEVHGSKL